MRARNWQDVAVAMLFSTLSACTAHRSAPGPSPLSNFAYIDLQPGWRIRVVVPILKSGGYKVQLQDVRNEKGTITMRTGKDFEGYGTDYYEVRPAENLLKIHFRSGEVHRNDGSRDKTSHPLVPLFNTSSDRQYVRILFLMRSSDRDHNQAILRASSAQQLEALTARVQFNPVENCRSQSETSCAWVPAGVVVRPEKKRGREWVPAL